MEKSDSQLIREVKEGNIESYSELILRYEKRIFLFISRILKPYRYDEMTDDLVQETFYKAYKNLHTFRDEDAAFSTWLYTIAKNTVLSELRRSRNSEIYIDEKYALSLVSHDPLPDQEILRQERAGVVREAIQKLPDTQRSALLLREYEEMEYKEIAQLLGLTVSSVKSLLFRARTSLRQQLESYILETYSEGRN
ncbi:RNA polymerase sigma factor, sigma-70 family protein [[Clostridium] ultunense Esp]|uniref:RNA polymerase sigma factor n=1 Tax=Thermicanus aegyptius TaxID=94009 RepID=UPI0002B6FF99|nr:sigma-70 family RNA polymerase sigma factor [Thermicanus aegyptius]CCQ93627.1 RNA polymerase sigma factor, sigma-70 family protein [[Clostridium] ultunense Esp]